MSEIADLIKVVVGTNATTGRNVTSNSEEGLPATGGTPPVYSCERHRQQLTVDGTVYC